MTEDSADYSQIAGRPRFSTASIRTVLQDAYGIDADLAALPSERDQNFRVIEDGVARYVVKVSNAAEQPPIVDLQRRAMDQLSAAGLGCPVVVPASDGQHVQVVDRHLVWVLTFLPGDLMADHAGRSAQLLRAFGVFLGRVTRALADFEHPAADRHLQWNVLQAEAVLSRYLPDVEESRRRLVQTALDAFAVRVEPALSQLPRSVIHNDANDHNVLIDGDTITGLIDFGDMVHSATLNELAVGCAYAALGQGDPTQVIQTVAAGHATSAPLTKEERALLPELVRTRLATSVAISAHQHTLDPHDAYLTVSEGQAWQTLAAMDDALPHN
ncbi:phosphotransferase [Leekyejoonella antrihumi]|nr:phosphotransferase [Leekyejoonella antrihumi]